MHGNIFHDIMKIEKNKNKIDTEEFNATKGTGLFYATLAKNIK